MKAAFDDSATYENPRVKRWFPGTRNALIAAVTLILASR